MDYFERTANEGKPLDDAHIFDCHGHFGPFSSFHIPGISADEFVSVLDRAGINSVAVSTSGNVVPSGNDVVYEAVSAYPSRFIGYARINANYPNEIKGELVRCFDELGFRGIKIHPYCDQVSATDPRYDEVWKFSQERNVPVLIHTWLSLRYADPLLDLCRPALFDSIARKWRGAVIILGHSGGEYDGILEAVKVAREHPNVYLDTASSRLYPGVIEMLVREAGAHKVLYGSDVPFISPIPQLGKVIYSNISEEEKRMILGENTAKLFSLEMEEKR